MINESICSRILKANALKKAPSVPICKLVGVRAFGLVPHRHCKKKHSFSYSVLYLIADNNLQNQYETYIKKSKIKMFLVFMEQITWEKLPEKPSEKMTEFFF